MLWYIRPLITAWGGDTNGPKGTKKTVLLHPGKLRWQWKKQPFEDVAPIKNADFPSFVFLGGLTLMMFLLRNMFHWTSRIPFQHKQQTYLLSCLICIYALLFLGKVSSNHAFSVCLWMLYRRAETLWKSKKTWLDTSFLYSCFQILGTPTQYPRCKLVNK